MIGIFVILSCVHIFALITKKFILKSITKALIIPIILAIYLLSVSYLERQFNPLIIAALCLGWLGDLILIPRKKIAVFCGGWFFWAEQVLLIVAVSKLTNLALINRGMLISIPTILALASFAYTILLLEKQTNLLMIVLATGYLATIAILNGISLCLLINNQAPCNISLYIGSLFFFISDALLIYVRLTKKPKFDTRHTLYMTLYIIAQALVMFAFI